MKLPTSTVYNQGQKLIDRKLITKECEITPPGKKALATRIELRNKIVVRKDDFLKEYGPEHYNLGNKLLWKTTQNKKGVEYVSLDSIGRSGSDADDVHIEIG